MKKKLTKKQMSVLDDLFNSELDEQQVLDKYNVSGSLFNRWLDDDDFAEQFDRRIAAAYRQSSAFVARYATVAAAKLVQLTDSSNPETARKACLDIISMRGKTADTEQKTAENERPEQVSLTPETATKILEVLAKEKNDENQK